MILPTSSLAGGETFNARLCIIGAGPAGISLALQFLGTGIDVILVAGGGEAPDATTQALYEGEIADEALHSPLTEYRHRRFGGSSVTWGGRCIPFDRIDFEKRPWIEGAEWPIGYDDVAPYYPAANALLEAGDCEYRAGSAVEGGMRPMIAGFAPQAFDMDAIERSSCPTNFAARYGHRLRAAPNIRVLMDAHAVEIEAGDPARVQLRTLDGKALTVAADALVIATGGIETPRLMLASRGSAHPRGLGNRHDLVGRNYLCHIAGTMGSLHFEGDPATIFHGYERAWDGTYCRRRLALRPEVQRAREIGNLVIRLHHPRLPDPAHGRGILSAIYLAKPFISYEYSKRLHGGETMGAGLFLRHALNVMREPFATAGFLLDWARTRTLAARKFPSLIVRPRNNTYSLDIHAEQVPNPESRVTLSQTRDIFGRPQARVDWRYRPKDIETVAVSLGLLREDIARWGGGRLDYDEDEIAPAMLRDGAYGGHHIGTARMGATPADGVVDADARVFGTENIYVAGSSIFPTSSQANPTLTIVAFALRLADHLKARLIPAPATRGGRPA